VTDVGGNIQMLQSKTGYSEATDIKENNVSGMFAGPPFRLMAFSSLANVRSG